MRARIPKQEAGTATGSRRLTRLVLVLLLLLVAPLTASGVGDSSIAGRAYQPDGSTPASGIKVRLWRNTAGSWSVYLTTYTGTDGTYSFTSLPNTTYAVEFRDDTSGAYIPEFWADKPSIDVADPIALAASEHRTGIDATLATACSIAGVVRDGSGSGLSGITVNAYANRGGTSYDTTTTASTTTLGDGSYVLGGLPVGSYGLQFFSGDYASHYRSADPTSGVTHISRATPVIVTGGQRGGIDETMLRLGAITGTVSSAGGPVANVTVDSYRWEGTGWIRQLTGMATSDAGGAFTATPLCPGRYKVLFTAPTTYPPQYHLSTLDLDAALEVTVGDGQTARLDTNLVASDTQAPVSSIEGVPAGWTNAVTASITATDGPAGSGVVSTWRAIDSDPATLSIGPFPVTREGTHTITYWSVDGFRNTEAAKTATVTLDFTPPTVSSDATTAPYGNTATIIVSASDALSGVDRVVHKVGASGVETTGATFVLGLGVHELYVGAYDVAGNWSGFSGPVVVTVVPPPEPPTTVSAVAVEPGPAAAVSWSDRSDVEAGYMIERAKDSTAGAAFSPVATVGPNVTGYTDTGGGLDRTSVWYYRVRAFNVAGTSAWALSSGTSLAVPRVTVHRFYNTRAGVHFYTASEVEKALVIATLGRIFVYEGPSYGAYASAADGAVPVYRFYNRRTGTHFYTASEEEKARVVSQLSHVYTLEGPSFFVMQSPGPDRLTVHRFYNSRTGVHFYTASETEKAQVIATLGRVYTYEGPAYYVPR